MAAHEPPALANFNPFQGLDEVANAPQEAPGPKPRARAPPKPKAPTKAALAKEKKEADAALNVFATPKPPKSKRARAAPKGEASPAKKAKKARDEEHRRAIAQLSAYASNEVLGPYLREKEAYDLGPRHLRSLTKNQAVDLVTNIEESLANGSHQALADHGVRQAMIVVENALHNRSRFKVGGTTEKCFANQHWRFLLERAKIKYGVGLGNLDPVAEMALITVSTSLLVHNQNVATTGTIDIDKPVAGSVGVEA